MIKEKQAAHDETMPQLAKALNAAMMEPILENFLKEEYPDRNLHFKRFQIGRVFHRPGKDCRILYRMFCKNGDGKYKKLLLSGIISARKNGYHKSQQEVRDSWPGCGAWKPVSFLPDLALKLYTFPYDPKLPYLGRLLEPETVSQFVEQHQEKGFGLSKEWKFVKVKPQIRKYRPYKRCLLRYRAIFENSRGEQQNIFFYGKTYNTDQSRYVFEALSRIGNNPANKNGVLNIPRVIAHIDNANTIWQLEWRGINFSRTIEKNFGWERLHESGYLPKIAAMIAALHCVEIPDEYLDSGPRPQVILENSNSHIIDILEFLPGKEKLLKHLAGKYANLAPADDVSIPKTTIHGTFKLAQILCRDGQLALVDFDSIAHGDPLYDIAEFASSLIFLSVSDGISKTSTSRSLEIFLSEYENRVQWACDRKRLAWYIVAFLLGKIHATLKRAEAEAQQNANAGFEMLQEWLAVAGK
ncbi:MAG: phosphotransferase family protein [bacterium]